MDTKRNESLNDDYLEVPNYWNYLDILIESDVTFAHTFWPEIIELYDIYKISEKETLMINKIGSWSTEFGLSLNKTGIYTRLTDLHGTELQAAISVKYSIY